MLEISQKYIEKAAALIVAEYDPEERAELARLIVAPVQNIEVKN